MGEYTGGTVATMVVIPLLLAVCVVGGIVADRMRRARVRQAERDTCAWVTIMAAVSAVTIAVCTWWGMYPWKAEYHEYRQVSGVVSTVTSRMVATGSGMEDKFVVRFGGDDREYGVLDTRIAAARIGDRLTVLCVRRWQWTGTHGYDCQFVDLVEATR